MNDIDTRLRDTLQRVATTTRTTDRIEEIVRHRQRRPLGITVGVVAFVVVVLVVGIPALLNSPQGQQQQVRSSEEPEVISPVPPVETSEASGELATTTVPSLDEEPATVPLSALPILGLDLPGWVPVDPSEEDGDEGGFRSVTYYQASEDESRFAVAKLWVRGIPAGSSHEEGQWWMSRTDYEAVTVRGHDARLFVSDGDYDFAWRESDDAVVTLSVLSGMETVTRDQALTIADSVIDLHPELWFELLLSAVDEAIPASPTTTSTWQQG